MRYSTPAFIRSDHASSKSEIGSTHEPTPLRGSARPGAPESGGHRHEPLPESRRTLPERYRNAPVKDRLAVLQGLFDTAGTPGAVDVSVTTARTYRASWPAAFTFDGAAVAAPRPTSTVPSDAGATTPPALLRKALRAITR